jgi:hypothetical protein
MGPAGGALVGGEVLLAFAPVLAIILAEEEGEASILTALLATTEALGFVRFSVSTKIRAKKNEQY